MGAGMVVCGFHIPALTWEDEAGRLGARNATPALDPPSVLDYRKGDPW